MRRFWTCAPMILLILLLAACGRDSKAEERALAIRAQLIGAATCTMESELSADYGDRLYVYTLTYQWNKAGGGMVTVLAPENIAGVTAIVEGGQTSLTYEGVRLETGSLSSEGLSPLDALPALLTQCREGYISDAGFEKWKDTGALSVTYGDPSKENPSPVTYRVWFAVDSGTPLYAEVMSEGKTVLRCEFHSFSFT